MLCRVAKFRLNHVKLTLMNITTMNYRPPFTAFKFSQAILTVPTVVCFSDGGKCCYHVVTNAHGGCLSMGDVFRACF